MPTSGLRSLRGHGDRARVVVEGQGVAGAAATTSVEASALRSDPRGPCPLVSVTLSRPPSASSALAAQTASRASRTSSGSGGAMPIPAAERDSRAMWRSIANGTTPTAAPDTVLRVSKTPSPTVKP